MTYQPVIGLEIHVELRTESKMFCPCPGDHFAKTPNTQVCPVCLGLPGALPVPNKKAIEWTQTLGAALECDLVSSSHFDRKHYFYPDLPKGYQISQYNEPLARNGKFQIQITNDKWIRIRRVHLEEDTGKLLHTVADRKRVTLVDFNRSGVPLVEIVTEPDFSSSVEAKDFAQELQRIVRYLGISDADMEKGSMRLEANISLWQNAKRPGTIRYGAGKTPTFAKSPTLQSYGDGAASAGRQNARLPDYRVEVKNINSFRFLEQAINYEIERQTKALEAGEKLAQETRGFDQNSMTTKSQRGKEEAQDYRYFPEPDIPPFSFTSVELEEIKRQLPELPESKRKRFEKEYKLPPHYVNVLTQSRYMADYFEEAVKVGEEHGIEAKKVADTMVNKKVDFENILPARLIQTLRETKERPVLSNEELEKAVKEVVGENASVAEDYRKGKEASLQFLAGLIMKKTKGQADPNKARELLLRFLDKKPQKE